MDEGPTTAGSIVGRLKMDRDQWVADMARTRDDARELSSLEPTIRVDADIAAALARLEQIRAAAEHAGVNTTATVTTTAVSAPATGSTNSGAASRTDAIAAAERRLALAESASEIASNRATTAEMRLNEVREQGGRTAAQMAAAELTAAEAVQRAEHAAERAVVAEEALASSQERAARAAIEQAAATETAERATVRANEANTTNASRVGMITAAVVALVPMLAPLAAFTIGAAGALTMMGVAGVAAVRGIQSEMIAGTSVGQSYRGGLQGMKADLDALSKTGAAGMLSSFTAVAGTLSASMPTLNRQVAEFSGFLGRTGSNLFSTAMNGLRILEPLMISIAGWVERLSAGFKSWSADGGLQKFAAYAMATLPQVQSALGGLLTLALRLLDGLAPLGTIGLGALTALSGALNALPVQVLGDLVAGVAAAWAAFKLWGFIAPMLAAVTEAAALATGSIALLGASVTIATGPIGWIVAGVAALVTVLAMSAVAADTAAASTASYTAALQADSGALGENVRLTAVKKLADDGALSSAKTLGVSAKTVTDAVLGNSVALKAVNDAVASATDKYKTLSTVQDKNGQANGDATRKAVETKDAIDKVTSSVGLNSSALQQSQADYALQQEALTGVTGVTNAQGQAVDDLARKYGMTTTQYLAATDSQTKTADQLTTTTQAMFIQGNAAGLLKQSLDLLNGKTLSAAGAQNQFDSQIANMSTHMNAAGKEVNRADTLLEGMTASAVKNRGELIGLTTAAEANAQAFRDSGGSAEDTRLKLISMKDEIIKNAIAHGEDAGQVQAFIDKLFQIPATIPPTKLEVDAAQASADLAAYQFKLGQIPPLLRTVMTVDQVMGTGVGVLKLPGSSDGSTVGGSGSSGVDSVPMMLAPREEIISNKKGQADKYRPLLKAINAGNVPSSVMPATSSSSPAPAGLGATPVTHKHYWKISTNDPVALFQAFTNRTNGLGAV
jgi:hypothetical protein